MAAMASSASAPNKLLETLPTRPPTPPQEAQQGTEVSLKAVLSRTPRDDRTNAQTPPNVNSLLSDGAPDSNPSSKRIRKKVVWSPHTEYKEPPSYREGSRLVRSSPLAILSPVSSKPVKSILKPSPSPNHLASSLRGQLDGSKDQPSIIEMLDSTIKQLAGTDRDSRVDAYMMLARALKASNNLPDRVALQNKMSLFMQFIQRDLVSKNEKGTPDSSLINHAITLLTTFLNFQSIASTLTTDFGISIIDHCIRCFGNPSMPKDIVRHLMQVVAFQNFSAKVMSQDRVGRLIASLHKIEDFLTGKSIVMGRIHIYKRLIKQARNHMATHTDWLQDMISDMLSTVKDIRNQAIALGTEAGFALRNEKQVMRKATETFQASNEDQTYIEYYIKELQKMMKEKQSASSVPQIWSVIILFLRCPLDKWQYFGPWLTLAQSSFNAADGQTKLEANHAWNRYTYLSLADGKINNKTLNLLIQPLNSQLKRKVNSKQPEESMKLRRAVLGGICTLFYYAFRPNHDKILTELIWDTSIDPTVGQLINLGEGKPEVHKDSTAQASKILTGLLDVSTPRGWKQERIMTLPPVSPEELPSLDPKWTRRNCGKVFKVITPILERRFTDLSNNESVMYRLWEVFCGSIAAASAKDIKVSEETAFFTAQALSFLMRIWSRGFPDGEHGLTTKFLPSVKNFTQVLIRALGHLPFTEKKLSMTISNGFEPVATPSRQDKPQGVVRVPLHHLMSMLCSIPPGASDNDALSNFVQAVFNPFFVDRPIKGRIELARELLRLLPRNTLSPYGPWILAAQNLPLALEHSQTTSNPNGPSVERGPEHREIVSLLERGLNSHPNLPLEHWSSLLELLSQHVGSECGDTGRALGVIEPISKMLLDSFFSVSMKPNATAMRVMSTLFDLAKLPRDRQAVEASRRRLWGALATASRIQHLDPFDSLYKLGNQSMRFLYDTLQCSGEDAAIASCLDSLQRFLVNTFAVVDVKSLVRLQEGLIPWVQDEHAQLKLSDESLISQALRALFEKICSELVSLGRLEGNQYDQLEPLFTAAFRSRHRFIVNKMAETWNTLLKDEESLACSASLKELVTSLRSSVDILLPGDDSSFRSDVEMQTFVESQDDFKSALPSARSSRHQYLLKTPQGTPTTKPGSKGTSTRKRRQNQTPEVKRSKPSKRTSTPRLRHDNSQIQFAPIVSSSPVVEESQHLTERQKEVRERQRETAHIYSSVGSGPRTRSRGKAMESAAEPEGTGSVEPQQDATPQRTASYEDFISLTPTPRRGHALQMEDYNEPPSSPPEPRRNPFFSEIQSRSKTTSSMETWEFSSPPGSPTPSHAETANGHHLANRDGHKPNNRGSHDEMDIIPPSTVVTTDESSDEHPDDAAVVGQQDSPKLSSHTVFKVSALQEAIADKSEETLKSGEDEFVDARSSPGNMSPIDNQRATQETSFALSEGDESSMMRFAVELESRRCDLPHTKPNSISPEKRKATTVLTNSSLSSPPSVPQEKEPQSPTAVPSTIAEAEKVEEAAPSESQRKRKRGAKTPDMRRKKRRSGVNDGASLTNHDQAVSNTSSPPAPSTFQNSRRIIGTRSRKSHGLSDHEPPSLDKPELDVRPVITFTGKVGEGDGDTDEELMSQLVTESFAASQQSQADDEENPVLTEDRPESGRKGEAGHDHEMEKISNDASGTQTVVPVPSSVKRTSLIMEMLREGLQGLRGAALSREEVYQMEDVLIDMR